MANDSFIFFVSIFVSLSIKGLKENAENLKYYPILRRKVELYLICFCQLTVNENYFCRFFQCCTLVSGNSYFHHKKCTESRIDLLQLVNLAHFDAPTRRRGLNFKECLLCMVGSLDGIYLN